MRKIVVAILLVAGVVANVQAEEPAKAYRLSKKGEQTLGQFGLSDLQPVERKVARKVRGTGGSAATRGHSFLSGMLLDGNSKSYVFGVDTNMGFATLTQGGLVDFVDPFHKQESNLGLSLDVENSFKGVLLGGAGGTATSYFR